MVPNVSEDGGLLEISHTAERVYNGIPSLKHVFQLKSQKFHF